MTAGITWPIKVAIGTVEVTDTDRRAIKWWRAGGDRELLTTGALSGHAFLADRDDTREYLRACGELGLSRLVARYLECGGKTASMEAGDR